MAKISSSKTSVGANNFNDSETKVTWDSRQHKGTAFLVGLLAAGVMTALMLVL